jgi:hypothetical protein
LIWIIVLFLQLGSATAPSTSFVAPEVFFSSRQDGGKKLEVVLVDVRSTTRPSASDRAAASSRAVQPDFVQTFEVRLYEEGHDIPKVVCKYTRNGYTAWSSPRSRYRILAAALIGDYVVVVQKLSLGTTALMIRPAKGNIGGAIVASKYVMTDSEADGPIVGSAQLLIKRSWQDSLLLINPERTHYGKYKSEFRLGDLFKEGLTGTMPTATTHPGN